MVPVTHLKNTSRKWKTTEAGDLRYILRNELDKTYFNRDAVNANNINVNNGTVSDKVLCDQNYQNILKILLASMMCNIFNKKAGATWTEKKTIH